jgi:hypothetical protein
MSRGLIRSAGWLPLFVLGAATAQPLPEGSPLTLPTPEGPKLELPRIKPADPAVTLDSVQPLRIQPQRERPGLGLLPHSAPAPAPEDDEEEPEGEEAPRAPYLEHGH